MYLLGYDVGSSSIKAALLDAQSGEVLASATSPKKELPINSPQPGWAEQAPEVWWKNLKSATAEIKSKVSVDLADVAAIGISIHGRVSMHGVAINLCNDLSPWRAIVPCGEPQIRPITLAEICGRRIEPVEMIQRMPKWLRSAWGYGEVTIQRDPNELLSSGNPPR